MKKPKFLLSDLDGVIRKYPQSRDLAIENKFGLPEGSIFSAAFQTPFLEEAVCGRISDEVWRIEVQRKLSEQCSFDIAKRVIKEWSDFPGQVNHEYLIALDQLFLGVPLAVLTNGTTRLGSDLKTLGLDNRFFKVFNSAEIGVCKPSKEIFFHVLDSLGCVASEVIFVDDSVSHVQAAQELGFKAHHFLTVEQFTAEFQR